MTEEQIRAIVREEMQDLATMVQVLQGEVIALEAEAHDIKVAVTGCRDNPPQP